MFISLRLWDPNRLDTPRNNISTYVLVLYSNIIVFIFCTEKFATSVAGYFSTLPISSISDWENWFIQKLGKQLQCHLIHLMPSYELDLETDGLITEWEAANSLKNYFFLQPVTSTNLWELLLRWLKANTPTVPK